MKNIKCNSNTIIFNMNRTFRYYQEEADNAIYEELIISNKCIVKMFCGTGKSILMRKCKVVENKKLVVYVFPSLSLVDQFYSDYLGDYPNEDILKICSENESTTDPIEIIQFLSKTTNKIICITYQSFGTLLENLGEMKINVCIFDEAHHAVGETYQKLIFENDVCVCEKQIFFTATPKNANGIIMYDREKLDAGMCGKLVYEYSYLTGVEDGYLNPIEIRIDMFSENNNKSVYESIVRSILASSNNRVLTFHSDVNTERDTSVNNFVDEVVFKRTFSEILEKEFPEKVGFYTKVSMLGLSSIHSGKERKRILNHFDRTPNNEIFVISSCETIGEGIDTKNANMCVFVDPKTSYVKIIQNIGRIVRKIFGQDKPKSTVLIPCWVDKTKYLECNGDKDKCDEVIRQDMSADGNFNGILNVLSALKQEDEELYDICLHYPDTYSPQEIKSNLEKQGYRIAEQVGDGTLTETMEHLLDAEIDYENYEDCETDEDMIMNIAEDNDVCIEIHTNSLENPVERYNSECESGEVVRIYKSYDDDLEEDIYQPIVKKEKGTKRNSGFINGPKRENRMNMKVHTNPDIKVLWNITSDLDLTKDICSCVIDCEVVKYDPMEVAIGIVERAKERERNGLNLLPRKIQKKENRNTIELEEENKDEQKLCDWKKALKGTGRGKCSDEIRDYLDTNLLNWRMELDKKAMEKAIAIVERANKRLENGLILLPQTIYISENRNNPELEQENKDASKLKNWRNALKGTAQGRCSTEVREYLDKNLKDWRNKQDLEKKAMKDVIEIVKRAKHRVIKGSKLLPRDTRLKSPTPESEQERKDAKKLRRLKDALIEKGTSKCYDETRDYLDQNLPGWRHITINSETQSVASVETQTIIEEEPKTFFVKIKPKKSMKLKKSVKKEESTEQKRERVKSEFSEMLKDFKRMTSENLHKLLNEQPELLHKFQKISEENEKSFPEDEIPRNRIIAELDKTDVENTKQIVVDMGCGKGEISHYYKNDERFQFINYDHVSSNDTIISCDISNIPLNIKVDICILSLAMWGSNCRDYIKEANRILKKNYSGKLYIIEPTKRWSEQDENGNIIPEKEGSKMKTLLEENGFQIVDQSIEKFCMFVCIKI